MSLQTNVYNTAGNHEILDGVQLSFDTMTNVPVPAATQPSIVCGTGAPTFSAIKGTVYIRLDGSSASTRMYVNSTGSTAWVNVTTSG